MRRIALLVAIVWATVLGAAGPASATTLVVTKTTDSTPGPSGACLSGFDCSLREAVTDAEDSTLHPGADTIQLPPGTYTLTNGALPTITTDVTIEGTGGAGGTTITGATTNAASSPQGAVLSANNFLAFLTLR